MIKDTNIKEWFKKNKSERNNKIAKILDVEYAHIKLQNKDDLYITSQGLPFIEHLKPENFLTDEKWFQKNSKCLSGTSSVYKVRTKKVNGIHKDIVIKWNRMGQNIPGADDRDDLICAEFNSPFEEFSLVVELRNAVLGSPITITIQKPLAIYVPLEPVEIWQSGRKEYKMQYKIDSHKEIALDMHRSYAVIYEWIEGIDAVQACDKHIINDKRMRSLTLDADKKMKKKGFVVRDNKPHHVIVRPKKKKELARDQKGKILYGLVDFELLERTPHREKIAQKDKRADYLRRQRDRFFGDDPNEFHPHLHHVNILGVEYVYGHVESTKGRLWVVGRDPHLFDYFLPERWEQIPKTKISVFNDMYYTISKDNIHLAWKVSKVGIKPDADPYKEDEKRILEYGYNTPFEEVAIALELSRKGIPTIYPRAIYMSSNKTKISDSLSDSSRYDMYKAFVTPDRVALLKKNRDYISIWGYWNGPDEKLAAKDSDYYEGIDTLRAYKQGIITEKQYYELLQIAKERLFQAGFEDLNFRGNHLLISFDSKKNLIVDSEGIPELRICNFEFLKKNNLKVKA
ncbi:hypothetical protein ACFL1E_06195 [Candidatus Omnitrophota bacterium]